LREEAINGLVGVHVTVLKSSIDLLLGAVMHNLLQALHHLPRRRWDCRYPITSLPTTASSSPTHSLPPSLSLSLSLSVGDSDLGRLVGFVTRWGFLSPMARRRRAKKQRYLIKRSLYRRLSLSLCTENPFSL
jgi:hypothetical protein